MAKTPKTMRTKSLVRGNLLSPKPIPGTCVVPDAAFRNDRHPLGSGPWKGEPDKFAWTDSATGYPCVVLREPTGEYGSHVGVPPTHSLSGHAAGAVPGELSDGLHRPISCAQPCQRRVPEPLSICHVLRRSPESARQLAGTDEVVDDAWWLGMVFNGPRDLVPNHPGKRALAAERGQTYRDARFAFEQATSLAKRLYEWDNASGSDRSLGTEASALPKPEGGDDR